MLLTYGSVICLAAYFYVRMMNQVFIVYKDAAGMWHEDRFRPLCTALVNLGLNLLLVQFIGIYALSLWLGGNMSDTNNKLGIFIDLAKENEELKAKTLDGSMIKEEVDAEDIAEVVSRWTGIPVARMLASEREKLLNM